MKLILTLAAVSAAYSVNSLAQTERDLDSHVHGSASLNVAISGSSVFIELNTPWNNLVGFEHAPNTDDQRALIDTALEHLNDPDHLFAFNAGDCSLDEVDVETAMGEDEHHDDHEGEGEHKDEHHDDHEGEGEHKDEHHDDHEGEHKDEHDDDHEGEGEHKDEHHDDHDGEGEHKDEHHDDDDGEGEHKEDHHDDEHANHEDEPETHSAVLAIYSYECKQIDKLNTIDATLFSIWSGFKDLDVQLIGDNGQTLVELDPENTVIDVAQVR